MKKRFYIVRHGKKVKIPGDPPLSEEGNKQAKLLAEHLRSIPVSKILTSPILRTRQTAKHIGDALGIEVETNELLKERVNWGDDPGQPFEDFLEMWTRASIDRDWIPPVGDSSRKSGERIAALIRELLKNNDEHIVLVTHGGVTTDFLRNTFTINELEKFVPNFAATLDENIRECSVTIVEADSTSGELRLIQIADTKHLAEV